jgi:hypothetical protein
MKGTVSPELRAIFRDPEMRKNFMMGFSKSDHTSNAIIDLGNNKNVVVTRFSASSSSPKTTRSRRRRRNIFEILSGK